jgi:hypothetical protein
MRAVAHALTERVAAARVDPNASTVLRTGVRSLGFRAQDHVGEKQAGEATREALQRVTACQPRGQALRQVVKTVRHLQLLLKRVREGEAVFPINTET